MKKETKYFIAFIVIMACALMANLLCIFGLFPYIYWRWSLAGIVLLLAVIWFLNGKIRKNDDSFDFFRTKTSKLVSGAVILMWGITFFIVIFLN